MDHAEDLMKKWTTASRNAKQTRLRSGSAGFTLIELMIVIVTLAILAGVATPSLMGYMRQRGVREAADQLAMDMQRAKLLAISRNANCSIIVDSANNRYTISLTNEIVNLNRYRGGVTFSAPIPVPAMITFNPQGLCTQTGTLFLTNADGVTPLELRTTLAGGISQH
jgi:prepilin-type N-terminal cleavage/methylation domain-containing protein